MKLRELMTTAVIHIAPEETVAVAARTLERYNIGALPVCAQDGSLKGLITDRDIVTRCLAANLSPAVTTVREIMTAQLVTADADLDAKQAAALMGQKQVRRLPVVENRKLCGIVSLADMAGKLDTQRTLSAISSNLSSRE